MKIGLIVWIIFAGVMVGLVLAYILVTTSTGENQTVQNGSHTPSQNNDVIFVNTSEDSTDALVVYGSILTDEEIEKARTDCEARGGTFDICASPCSGADVCIDVCAYACIQAPTF